MSNYKHNKQGKLTEMYAGEPKTRVNMSLTAKALAGLEEMVASGLGNSRSDVVEKLGRGELRPYRPLSSKCTRTYSKAKTLSR